MKIKREDDYEKSEYTLVFSPPKALLLNISICGIISLTRDEMLRFSLSVNRLKKFLVVIVLLRGINFLKNSLNE